MNKARIAGAVWHYKLKTREVRLKQGIRILPAVLGNLDRIADEIGIERIAS